MGYKILCSLIILCFLACSNEPSSPDENRQPTDKGSPSTVTPISSASAETAKESDKKEPTKEAEAYLPPRHPLPATEPEPAKEPDTNPATVPSQPKSKSQSPSPQTETQAKTVESYMDKWSYNSDAGLVFYDKEDNTWAYQKNEVHPIAKVLLDMMKGPLNKFADELRKKGNIRLLKMNDILPIASSNLKQVLNETLSKATGNTIVVKASNTAQQDLIAFEKIKILNDFVTGYIKYDKSDKPVRMPFFMEDGFIADPKTPAVSLLSIINRRKAICDGYVILLKLLYSVADIQGTELVLVAGKSARSGSNDLDNSHIWAMVKVGGKWYFTDPTWSTYSNTGEYNSNYVFADPKAFIHSHFPEDTEKKDMKPTLLEQAFTEKDFNELPRLSGGFFARGLKPVAKSMLENTDAGKVMRIIALKGTQLKVTLDIYEKDMKTKTTDIKEPDKENIYTFKIPEKFVKIRMSVDGDVVFEK